MSNGNGYAGFGYGFLAGAVIGLAVGILYAPKSGRETRMLLREKASEEWEKAGEVVGEVREKAGEVVERMKEKVAEVRGRGRETTTE